MGIKNLLYPFYYKHLLPLKVATKHRNVIKQIKKKKNATVLFLVSNESMWRCQSLYELLKRDERFNPQIAFLPFSTFDKSQKILCIRQLRELFSKTETPFIDLFEINNPVEFIKKNISPDVIFFPQPYQGIYDHLDFTDFEDRLLCYTPYGIITFDQPWIYNLRFNNVAWKLYFPSIVDKICARNDANNKGKNVVVVGNTTAEQYSRENVAPIWKNLPARLKRVIWAPHFSITGNDFLHRASFLELANPMLVIAEKYKDKVQFAFKPHPRLKSELYKHPKWGEEKTNAYYSIWSNRANTQLETDGYIELFKESDALIHDSGSFTAEYHCTGKPAMFFTSDKQEAEQQLNELGKAAFDAHYIGSTVKDIELFIDTVVLQGKDPLKKSRIDFFQKYLLPPNGKTAAENIYDDLVKSLKLENR